MAIDVNVSAALQPWMNNCDLFILFKGPIVVIDQKSNTIYNLYHH